MSGKIYDAVMFALAIGAMMVLALCFALAVGLVLVGAGF